MPGDPGGGVPHVVFTSRQPPPGDRFSAFRVDTDRLAYTAPKSLAAGVETQGIDVSSPSGTRYVACREPGTIRLESCLP